MKSLIALLLLISLLTPQSKADVLTEGWYKLLLGQQHIGYIVQRFELNKKKNQVQMTSFLRTNALGGDITESIQANSTVGFEPISFQYSILKGKDATLIDANFTGDQSVVKVTEKGGKLQTFRDKIPKGTFLSYFLPYVMTSYKNPKDANDSGIKVGRSFNFSAVAEEDGKIAKGVSDVLGTEKVGGLDVFRVRVKFKDIQSISLMTGNAEVVQINQPISGHQVKISTREEATKGFPSSEKSLKTLFGTIPKDNPLAQLSASAPPEAAPSKDLPAKKPQPDLGVEPNLNVNDGSKIFVPPGKPVGK